MSRCRGDAVCEEQPVAATVIFPSCFSCRRAGRECKKTTPKKILMGFHCGGYSPDEEIDLEAKEEFIGLVGLKLALEVLAKPTKK